MLSWWVFTASEEFCKIDFLLHRLRRPCSMHSRRIWSRWRAARKALPGLWHCYSLKKLDFRLYHHTQQHLLIIMLGQYIILCWLHLKTAFTVYSEAIYAGLALYILSAACRYKCETISHLLPHPLTWHKALLTQTNCRYEFTDCEGMIAWLARALVYVDNVLRAISWLNPNVSVGIEPRSTAQRPEKQISQCAPDPLHQWPVA